VAAGSRRVVVGVTGASGAIYAVRLLERLRRAGREIHLVATSAGLLNVHHELGLDRNALEALADVAYRPADVGAAIASGSFAAEATVIAPCSMKSLAAIANGLSDNLLTRAADVALKERRKLVLMVRETPLNLAHLRNMTSVTEMGAIVFPPLPAFYHRPQTIEEIVADTTERVAALLGIEDAQPKSWPGLRSGAG
jgi:4-hydroxy-3-polyprenylbenzoate decarboxylase